MSELRIQLIERICRLQEHQLADVEAFFLCLEQKESSHSIQSSGVDDTPSILAQEKNWPHAPVHQLSESGTYIVTAGTDHKQHFFRGAERLSLVENMLLALAKQYDVVIEAWAVFSNHYHFVAHTVGGENQLRNIIARLHYDSAEEINRRDGTPGRPVWFNFWDTRLTFQKSYFARLNYVHQNAVKHGLVLQASDYPWCSAAWFERTATAPQRKTISNFKTDRVKIDDDYQPVL
jgi:putative transposase